eukprot:7268912-Alexandrium_andersonii.AAC.1
MGLRQGPGPAAPPATAAGRRVRLSRSRRRRLQRLPRRREDALLREVDEGGVVGPRAGPDEVELVGH